MFREILKTLFLVVSVLLFIGGCIGFALAAGPLGFKVFVAILVFVVAPAFAYALYKS